MVNLPVLKIREEAKAILEEAEQKFGIKKFYACISGGKDSVTAADVLNKLGKLSGVVFCDTGIGLEETKDFVINLCKRNKWELIMLHPKEKETYEDFVSRFGFPHQGMHGAIMGFLKHHPMRKFVTERKKERIGLVSGIRRLESNRRGRTAKPMSKEGNLIFVAPLFNWTTEEVWNYVRQNNLEVSPVYKTLHLSGDCLCGAFSDNSEAELISLFYPQFAKRVKELEINCKRKYNKWGNQSSMAGALNQSRLEAFTCADCQISNKEAV